MSRPIPDPGFPGDPGDADPALAAALQRWAGGGSASAVHEALAGGRVLVPVVAVAAEIDAGTGAEKSTDMALVTIRGADGRVALPAFTCLAALAAWDARARPVPVAAQAACLAAVAEGAHLLVLDAAGPVTFPVEGAALRALAQGRAPQPPLADPAVAAAVRDIVAAEPAVALACLLGPLASADGSPPADAVLALALAAGVDAAAGAALAGRLGAALAGVPVLRERLDGGLDIALLSPGAVAEAAADAIVLLDRR